MQVWCRLIHDNKLIHSNLLELVSTDLPPFVEKICEEHDLSRPCVLSKHEKEWQNFSHTVFTKEHFMDAFDYDRLELEIVKTKKKKNEEA